MLTSEAQSTESLFDPSLSWASRSDCPLIGKSVPDLKGYSEGVLVTRVPSSQSPKVAGSSILSLRVPTQEME